MPVRINKIVTKTGDQGETGLADGTRISKGELLMDCIGACDELNAQIGNMRASNALPEINSLDETIVTIQHRLFDIGAIIARQDEAEEIEMLNTETDKLETLLEELNDGLPELTSFVIPGGHTINTQAHLCRTECRRLERLLIRQHANVKISASVLRYINRLSDFFFVYSRWTLKQLIISEVLWKPVKK